MKWAGRCVIRHSYFGEAQPAGLPGSAQPESFRTSSRRRGHATRPRGRIASYSAPRERVAISARNRRNRDDDSRRVNKQIRDDQVRVVDPDGEQIGVMDVDDALDKADDYDLDLVEVAPQADPVVCKIMDYGKFKYEQSKKKSSKSDNVSLKTLRFRPKTSDHDLQTKLDRAVDFLDKGNQVKLVIQMRGRERKYTDRWREKLEETIEELRDQIDRDVKIVSSPESEGWKITSIVEPA
ncbi:MAG: translation initiation factor IF-3 [Bradymonadaceae bacterium]